MSSAGRGGLKGIFLALAGFTLWVLADSTIKLIGKFSLPAYEVIAYLGLFIVIILSTYAGIRGDLQSLRPRNPRHQLIRSCLDLSNNTCVVVALRHMPLTLFYILIFSAPMLITVLAAILLGEKIERNKVFALLAGFLGVVVAVNPFSSAHPGDWIGYIACAVCVVCFSASMVWSRVLTQTETPESLTFCSGAMMAITGCGTMLWHAAPLTSGALGALFAGGMLCAFGSICFFMALKHTSAANVSQYHYTQLLTGAAVAYLVWREVPNPSMVLGAILIIASGLYIAWKASQTEKDMGHL